MTTGPSLLDRLGPNLRKAVGEREAIGMSVSRWVTRRSILQGVAATALIKMPTAWAEAAADTPETLARDAYIWGYPLVMFSRYLDAYKQHRVCFFYLNVGTEIARCEIPHWVAEDPDLLAAAHTLCVDQAHKGFGYPVALAEAHEQAIVRNAEKDAFFLLLERMMITSGQTAAQTQKNVSKRARRI